MKTALSLVMIILGIGMLTGCNQQAPQPIADILSSEVEANGNIDWKTYQNKEYRFTFDYPSELLVRDGIKDHKPAGLLNFYQLCGEIITTSQEASLGSNDNFVGYCKNGVFRIDVWKPSTNISQIQTDFSMLPLAETNALTIGNMPASEFVYAGNSNVDGGSHIWHLFVAKTKEFTYSMYGDYCMDNDIATCYQILSTFQFTNN